MDRKKSLVIIVIVLVLLLCCLGIIGVLLIKNKESTEYDKFITTATRYYDAGDYDNAIVAYKEALEINDSDEDAYIGIAEAYYHKNDISTALKYLEAGYKKTKSNKIKNMIEVYNNYAGAPVSEPYTLEQVMNGSGDITIKQEVFRMLSISDYSQYSEHELAASSTSDKIVYTDIPAIFSYSSAPSGDMKPDSIQVTSLGYLFDGLVSGISYERLGQLNLIDLKIVDKSVHGVTCVEFIYVGCRVIIQSDENGNIVLEDPWIVIQPVSAEEINEIQASNNNDDIQNDEPEVGYCILKGVAYNDAQSGDSQKVHIKVYSGTEASDADLYMEFDTDAKGNYRIEIEPGRYFAQLIIDKDVVGEHEFELRKPDVVEKIDMSYTHERELRQGEILVVLSWDDPNGNLDHDLWGYNSDGETVNCSHWSGDYGNHYHTDSNGELVISSGPEVMGGPETVTVYDIGGYYTYTVFADGTTSLAGAKVEVYTAGSTTPIVFECPADYTGYSWDVFVYENGDVRAL